MAACSPLTAALCPSRSAGPCFCLCRVGGWGLHFHRAPRNARGFCALKGLRVGCKGRMGAHTPSTGGQPKAPDVVNIPAPAPLALWELGHPLSSRAVPEEDALSPPTLLREVCVPCREQGLEVRGQGGWRLETAVLSVPTGTPVLLSFPHGLLHVGATPWAPERVPEAAPRSA